MGLPDTSPVPKKDWMGMDYIPVYEGEEQDDGTTVKVSLDKIQRSGVRTERVEARILVQPVRAVGTVKMMCTGRSRFGTPFLKNTSALSSTSYNVRCCSTCRARLWSK
jgi:hypothetical protein